MDMYDILERLSKVAVNESRRLKKLGEQDDIQRPRHPQELDYQAGPEDDEQYRRHHGLGDPGRKRERKLRATDHKTLDRLERQAMNRAMQMDEEDIDEVSRGEYIKQQDTKAERTGKDKFKAFGQTFDTDEVDEGRNDPSPLDDPLTRFRKKHAPSVMRDPKAREELSKLDTEYGERKKTAYGRGEEEDEDDEEGGKKDKPAGEKRGRGRPKGSKRAIGAKGPTGRSKLMRMAENDNGIRDDMIYEIEMILDGAMAGDDQTDHIIDELGDLYADIENSGDKVALKAYEIMNGSIDEGSDAQTQAAQIALKMLKGAVKEDYDRDEYDEEGEMAMSQARTIEDAAEELQSILDADENLPEWVQKKISMAKEYIDTARDYLKANRPEDDMAMAEASTGDYSAKKARAGKDIGKPGKQFAKIAKSAGERYGSKERGEKVAGAVLAKLRAKESAGEELEEKAVSKAQRKAAGIAYAAKKGEIPKSELRGASKEMAKMKGSELKKFAKTKEKGLPEKKKEESVEETTTSGSVATAAGTPKSNKGGMQFGKGVYEDRLQKLYSQELKKYLGEGTTVTLNSPDQGEPSVSVNATGQDASSLSDLLKMAGLFSSGGYQPLCSSCGGMHEGACEMVDEEYANEPNEMTQDTDFVTNTVSGGLNGPKRQVNPNNPGDNPLAMKSLGTTAHSLNLEETVEKRLFDLYTKYEGK